MNIGSYQLGERMGASAGGTLHLARHLQDGTLALLKLPRRDSAGAADGVRLKHEYALLQLLDAPEILKPLALQEEGAPPVLVLEPFTGDSLEAVLARQRRMALPVALAIACQLARALAALHAAGIVHHDLRPANILFAPNDSQVKLADLSRAAAREGATSARPVAGDWAYVSPEQTGRMNRQADYRTDFYSLGILLYRMLTGQLPFQADDPLEWAHCHLARLPVPPRQLAPDLPQAVSDLVLKLLAKVPEERYQSAGGLQADLERCLSQWQASGEIAPFALGARDASDRFQLPHTLYGREQERAALLAAFETVATTGAPMLVTVAGYSGVGKSALVHALQQPILEKRGHFIAGKFDQYQHGIPYAPLAQAFDRLARQLLSESDAAIGQWREALGEALGPNGQLMVTLIPQLALILGPQPPVPDLPPQEAQRRFQLVFRRLLGVFARAEHPLALFLDDLQWADAATLDLLADLATHPDVRYLLLVGAYRDNEVDASHPLQRCLEAVREAGGAVQEIALAPLMPREVGRLIAETLHCSPAQAQPLAQLLWEKTGGNPFFTRQFLAALAEEKLLTFDAGSVKWVWNLKRIQAKGYTDNVVNLMVDKLARLPPDTQDALKQFACLGNAADAATLSLLLGQSGAAVHAVLGEAQRAGLVWRQEETYLFLHDRVQEAAYSLIPSDSRAEMHLRIGRLLASRLAPEAIAERIFEVVGQLNRGVSLVESRPERERIAELNLLAGQRAKAATAYVPALAYLSAGAGLLAEDGWERRHELLFQLELHRAECEFLTGALAEAEARLAALSTRAADTLERAAVACLWVDVYATTGQGERVVAVGLDYLRHQGIDWSPHPTDEEVRHEYERFWQQLGSRAIEELIELPLMSDPASLATLDVLIKIVQPAFFMDVNLPFLAICRGSNLSLEGGNCDASCAHYGWLGMVASLRFGDYQAAYRFGRLGCDLIERRGLKRFQARTYLLSGAHLVIWAKHIRASYDLLRRAFDAANQSGDLTCAAHCCALLNTNLLLAGAPLIEVQREAERGLAFAQKMRYSVAIDLISVQLGLIRTLRGLTPAFGCLDDGQLDERQMENRFASNPALARPACWYWMHKLQARFLAGDHASAFEAVSKVQPHLHTLLTAGEYRFYAALATAACYDSTLPDQRASHWEALAAHHRQLQAWAATCPENFENRAALVGAEMARLEGRDLDAMRLYEQAIRSARDNGFVQNEGIAHELAARFYLARDLHTAGHAHLAQAHACHAQWGADGKVRQLEEQYPQLRERTERALTAPAEAGSRLDLLSVAKASQAISGRIVLDEVIDTLMRIVLENAGAQTGCLLLARNDELALVAEAHVEQQSVRVQLHSGPTPPDMAVPAAILNYVRRSREQVLLMDAAEPHPFAADPYFARRHPKSVLCLPILRQAALIGVLYLEHNLATHAFPRSRIEVLEVLASQAAISLENAQLFATVQERNARIRRLVDSNIIGVFFWGPGGIITETNDTFLRMTGCSRPDLAAGEVNWERMTPPEYRALDERKAAEVHATRTCTPYEKEFIRKDGSRIPVLVGAVLFDGAQDQGVAFVLDLSEHKRAEAERQARQAAEAANRAKSAFLANMSHELRTPLNGILGYAQILQRDRTLGEQQLSGVNVIRQSGEHLLALINDILDLAKIEAGKMELHSTDIPQFARFVQTIVEMIGVKTAQKGLDFICDLAPDVPQGIRADEKRLRQVLLNLLSNAVKFTDRGQVTLRVRFTPPSRLRFEVRDSGIGIGTDQMNAIFQPFEQVGDMQRRLGGTGLGLSISRQYVRLMGGEIHVESRLGQGSTFWFELEVPVVEAETAAAASRIVTGYSGPRKMVLVVDDEAENRTVAARMLRPLGFEVAEAANGREGLDMAQRLRPHLILMDIAMPEMDGVEAVRRLRQLAAFKDVPVIAASASVSAADSKKSLEAGMSAFLSKPLDMDKLLEQMGALLQLEWIYASEAQSSSELETIGPIVVPPAEEMEALHSLARMGNMQRIVEYANHLAQLDERYSPFANQLRSLAKNYESKALLCLVEQYLHSDRLSNQPHHEL